MVEGPGCKLNGEKIRSSFTGQTAKQVNGNAVDKKKEKLPMTKSKFAVLVGRKLDAVQTLGKELFIYFGDLCLRVHFLMNGSISIIKNNPKKNQQLNDKVMLEVTFEKQILEFNECHVDIRSTELCKQKYEDLNNLDVCSPIFNYKRAVAVVMEQKGRQLCDVLLDQMLLPGVGNIIKNEAFFDSGIQPSSKVDELTEEHIIHLVKMTKDFTALFYKCRKEGTNLYKFMKIYGKKKCAQCEGKVVVCRMGDDSARLTHFCPVCQNNDLTRSRTLPSKNSLLSWVQSNKKTTSIEEAQWACDACTFLNKASYHNCEICQQQRTINLMSDNQESQSISRLQPIENQLPALPQMSSLSTGNLVPQNKTFSSGLHASQNIALSTGNLVPQNKTIAMGTNVPQTRTLSTGTNLSQTRTLSTGTNLSQTRTLSTGSNMSQSRPVKRKSDTTLTSSTDNKRPKTTTKEQAPASSTEDNSKIPSCPGHNIKCSLREVHKKGDNLGRFFFSCKVRPQNKQCKFFKWADDAFPICEGHGKPCTLRTVMKQGANNGRRFFACKQPRNKQCGFFQWAVGFDVD